MGAASRASSPTTVSGRRAGTTTVAVRLRGADRVGAGGQWLGRLGRGRFTDQLPDAPGERRVADRRGSERAARAAHGSTSRRSRTPRSTSSTRAPGSWSPRSCTCPRGQQLTTALVQALVLGPQPSLAGVVRTFVPAGLDGEPGRRSATGSPTSRSAVRPPAAQPTDHALMLDPAGVDPASGPLGQAFTVNIAGTSVTDARGRRLPRRRRRARRYDPVGAARQPSSTRCGDGLLVSGPPTQLTRWRARSARATRDRTVRVSLDSDQLAGVTPTVAARASAPVTAARRAQAVVDRARVCCAGVGLRRPGVGGPERRPAAPRSCTSSRATSHAPGTRGHRRGRPRVPRLPRRLADHRRPARGRA